MKQMTEKQFRKHVAQVKLPAGFTAEFKTESWGQGSSSFVSYVITKQDDTIITFTQHGSGHTEFKTDKGTWLSFDRTGVEDSFYHYDTFSIRGREKKYDLNVLVQEQLERIEKRREYYRSAVSIPGIPFTVAPAGVEDLKKRLAKQGRISFHPSGFGTGYVISKRKPPGYQYGGKQASPELEKFLGCSPLYITTMDCD